MQTDSLTLDRQDLLRRINEAYGLRIGSLTFLPKGEDAYAYLGQDDAGGRHFVRVQPPSERPAAICASETPKRASSSCGR